LKFNNNEEGFEKILLVLNFGFTETFLGLLSTFKGENSYL